MQYAAMTKDECNAADERFPTASLCIIYSITRKGNQNKCNHEGHPKLNERTHLTGQAKSTNEIRTQICADEHRKKREQRTNN